MQSHHKINPYEVITLFADFAEFFTRYVQEEMVVSGELHERMKKVNEELFELVEWLDTRN